MTTVAALFVETNGCYFGLPDVDPWDIERDARLYAGPHPVVAHPPCERWGRYANGGPGFRGAVRPMVGDDDGCFGRALHSVRCWGGVLEHPADSLAWEHYGLVKPASIGWTPVDQFGGASCEVEQGWYGHRARKRTWLYVVSRNAGNIGIMTGRSTPAPSVNSTPQILPPGRRESRTGIVQRMSRKQRRATPPAFRDLLLSIARSARP